MARGRAAALMLAPLLSAVDAEFTWPTAADVRAAQDAVLGSRAPANVAPPHPAVTLGADGLHRTTDGTIWIPAAATDLQLRVCIVGHTGLAGHRGTQTTIHLISSVFYWSTLREDVTLFCSTCLHCRSTLGGTIEPRPWGEALHASRPNEVLHFDFLFMGPADTGAQYLLLLKDDLSIFVWLVPCANADTQATTNALTDWFASFGISTTWVSDRGSHFKNKAVEAVRKGLRTQHHFTTANTPWANGTIEQLCQ
jgi:hypothetical protein